MQNLIGRYKLLALVLCFIVSILSISVLLIYKSGFFWSTNLFKGSLLPNPLAAIGFLLASVSLYCVASQNARFHFPGKILAFFLLFIGLTRFIAFQNSYSLGIEQWLFPNKLILYGSNGKANSMAPNTALLFAAMGFSLLLYRFKIGQKNRLSDYFAFCITIVSFFCITGYLYHSIELYQVSNQIPMSFLSAMLFFLISIAVLLTRCEFGFFSLFTKKYIGSKVARILIPVAVIISIVLGVLRLYVEKTNYFSSTLLVAIFAMANLIIFMILIWRCCIYLNKENKAYNLELRKRSIAEEELKTSEQFLNTLIENLPEMIFLKDENLRFVRVNKAAEDTVGILRDQLIGKTDYDFFPTDQADHFTKNDREVFCQNEILVIPEEKIAVRDEIRLLHTKKIVFEGPNQSKYLLGISQDITERKKLDQEIIQLNKDLERKVIERTEQLSRSEKRFRTLIETSSDVITMRDKEGKLVYVSPGIEKLTGYSIAETKAKSLFSLVFPEDQETLFAVYKKVINLPNIPHFYTVRIISKSDEIIWVEGFIVNQLEEEFINAIVSNFKDVTQRKKNEEEKKLLEKHLLDERIDQHKKLILSNIEGQEREKKQIGMELHDNINQVLTSTKLCLEIAESNENLRNAMLLKSKDQLNLAINEIRKLSKTLLPHEKDCGGIIENINEIVQTIHLSTGIHFIIQVEETATNLLDNKEQITVYRIIQEQLNNITKHACATNASLKLKEKDDCIELLITDDGNGFDINAKRQGIGFANIKNRVESLNGKMLVSSSKGNGCKMEIKIFRKD